MTTSSVGTRPSSSIMASRAATRASRLVSSSMRAWISTWRSLHLLQGEAKVLQRDNAVEVGQLAGLIEPVPGGRIHAGGPKHG